MEKKETSILAYIGDPTVPFRRKGRLIKEQL